MSTDTSGRAGGLDRFLRIFADVRAGEGTTALLLTLDIFLLLTAYYILKPVREALILGSVVEDAARAAVDAGTAGASRWRSTSASATPGSSESATCSRRRSSSSARPFFVLGGSGFAMVNILIVTGWRVLAFAVGRE